MTEHSRLQAKGTGLISIVLCLKVSDVRLIVTVTHSQQKEENQKGYPSNHVWDLQAEVTGDNEMMETRRLTSGQRKGRRRRMMAYSIPIDPKYSHLTNGSDEQAHLLTKFN